MPICQERSCDDRATPTALCAVHQEIREIELDLAREAAALCHDDIAQELTDQAVADALRPLGDTLPSSRAVTIAVSAALRALEEEGLLLPGRATTTRAWRAVADDGALLTDLMTDDQMEEWMLTRGLRDGEHLETVRTVTTPIPRELLAPAPTAEHLAFAGEGDF